MNIYFKLGFLVIAIIAFWFVSAYLFNHVNAWLGYGVMIVAIIVFVATIASIITQQIKKQK